jgi:hypothetical protein
MNNCTGCGAVLDPTDEQVNSAVDEVLHTSLEHAQKHGGVCPLCGHSKAVPPAHRKSVQFALLLACLLTGAGYWIYTAGLQETRRLAAARDAVAGMNASAPLTQLLGKPIRLQMGIEGQVTQDESGWQEARLTIPVRGPLGTGIARVAAGRVTGAWTYSTYEVVIASQHKKVELLSGRVVEYDPSAYTDVHTLPAIPTEFTNMAPMPPHLDGFPCVYGVIAGAKALPEWASAPRRRSLADRWIVQRQICGMRGSSFARRTCTWTMIFRCR